LLRRRAQTRPMIAPPTGPPKSRHRANNSVYHWFSQSLSRVGDGGYGPRPVTLMQTTMNKIRIAADSRPPEIAPAAIPKKTRRVFLNAGRIIASVSHRQADAASVSVDLVAPVAMGRNHDSNCCSDWRASRNAHARCDNGEVIVVRTRSRRYF